MPVADGDYRKKLANSRARVARGEVKRKRERAFGNPKTITQQISEDQKDIAAQMYPLPGEERWDQSARQLTRGGGMFGDLLGLAMQTPKLQDIVAVPSRILRSSVGSSMPLIANERLSAAMSPEERSDYVSKRAEELGMGIAGSTTPKGIKLGELLDISPVTKAVSNESNLSKLQGLVDMGTIRSTVAERFGEAGSFPVNVDAVRRLVSRAGLDDVIVVPQGARRPKGVPSIQRVDVETPKQKRVDSKPVFDEAGNPVMNEPERRVGLFSPEGEVSSLAGAVLGASPIPGYRGGEFMGGQSMTKLLRDPAILDIIRQNYGAGVRNTAETFGPRGQSVLADNFYQTTQMVGDDMAAFFAGKELPGGRPVTSNIVSDIGAMMSSGTKPEIQIAQQAAIIDIATGASPRIAGKITAATDALRALNEQVFATSKEANEALAKWSSQYLKGDKGLASEVNAALMAQKLGTQRSKGNVENVLSGGAHVVGSKADGWRIAGHFGVPRAEHYGPRNMTKTVMYGDAQGNPYAQEVSGVKALVNDIWDDNVGGILKYEPQKGANYAAKTEAAAAGFADQAGVLAARYKKQGLSKAEIARRLASPHNQQQLLWDALRSHISPTVITPIVKRGTR